ncbi:MAG: glycosyltransferase family 2 protein [Bacteroidaceae bacterium]
MKEPLISFIIPYYNLTEELLDRCIHSILQQEMCTNLYEIWLIDDGSDKSPATFLNKFNQPNIYYYHQENAGPGGARNQGILLAKGRYIQFVDGDDYLLPNSLQHYLPLIEQGKCDLLNFQYVDCKELEPQLVEQTDLTITHTTGISYMLHNNLYAHPYLFIFRKELAIQNQVFFPADLYHEDEVFAPKIYIHAEKVITTNLKVYAYYDREDSITHEKSKRHLIKRFLDIRQVLHILLDYREKLEKDKQKALTRKIDQLTMDFMICVMYELHSYNYLQKQLKFLHELGLYPLANKHYTYKYTLFRYLSSHKLGLRCLNLFVPLLLKL